MIRASDCKCCECGEQAVAFWPVIDPDIPSHPYCRKCLDKAKLQLFIRLTEIDKKNNESMTEVINVKILHLVLKKKWYEMQERGEKTEEYREITPYWKNRLALYDNRDNLIGLNHRDYTHVCFRYGYTQRCFINRIDSITIGRGKPEWGAPTDRDVFIIKHHREPSPFIKGKEL